MRAAALKAPQVQRDAVRAGERLVQVSRRPGGRVRTVAVGNQLRVSGPVDVPRVSREIASAADFGIEESWR